MTIPVTRRAAISTMLAGTAAMAVTPLFGDEPASATNPVNNPPVTGQPSGKLSAFDDLMISFIQTHQVPGAALAISRNSELVYARGFGMADVAAERRVQPDSLFRIASISKPVTAVAIMQQVEQSKFGLDDRVFDILPAADWLPEKHDERLRAITVRHLLQHTAGWDRDITFDPITKARDIAKTLKKSLPVGPADVIRYTLTLPLDFDPGERYAYYNVDYLLLGRLIEHATGQPYEAYVKQHVLAPAGVTRMSLGRAWKGDLAADEVRYYDPQRRRVKAVNGSKLGARVPIVYGGENVEAFEAHGGWTASAIDLVRFACAFDDPAACKLLKPETIELMWSRPTGSAGHDDDGKPRDAFYACGWNVRPVGEDGRANTWHSGRIVGTSTMLVRRHDGLNWAVLFNTDSSSDDKSLSTQIDPLLHQAAGRAMSNEQ